jgi:large subunit ribosomal protein L25
MTNLAFKLEERTSNEKAKATRRNGQTPCVIYGLDNPISAKISNSTLPKLLHAHLSTSILPLDINDSIKKCVIKDIQKDCYGKIIHLDFQYVQSNQIIKIKVPVTFQGQNILSTKKLVLESFVSEIEVQGSAEKIPENINIDVSNMEYEDKIIAKNIKLPDDIHLTTNGDTLLAHIAGSNPIEDEDESAEATE